MVDENLYVMLDENLYVTWDLVFDLMQDKKHEMLYITMCLIN